MNEARSPELNTFVVGDGPPVLFIHGSAVDHGTWSLQRTRVASQLRMILYDRRGTNGSGGVDGDAPVSVEAHADDAAALIGRHAGGIAFVCASSFGAVIALELIRRHRTSVGGAILIEPPVHVGDAPDPASARGLEAFDRRAQLLGGPAAAAFFFEEMLGPGAFQRVPAAFRQRAEARWQEIRRDWAALNAYRLPWMELRALRTPVLLLGGERSHPRFAPTLRALKDTLPEATLEFLPCGHTIQAEAHRAFNARLLARATGGELGEAQQG